MKVIVYNTTLKSEWDSFVNEAKNSSFLLMRNYMDYHSDRFTDHSLMIYNADRIIAVLPANLRSDNVVCSHDGLTYGGFVFHPSIRLSDALLAIADVLDFLNSSGIDELNLKIIPKFYQTKPSDEVDYAMFLCNARLYRRDTAFVVDQLSRIQYSASYLREVKKSTKLGNIVIELADVRTFWEDVLEPNLFVRYGVKPVHSMKEIITLMQKFPESIKCYGVTDVNGAVLCGTIMFLSKNVAHAQYISSNNAGRQTGAMNHLFVELLDNILFKYRFFDFGIANENNGLKLNQGLKDWKERFGGRTMVHDFYRINTGCSHSIKKAALGSEIND
jgi:hypothetical protein